MEEKNEKKSKMLLQYFRRGGWTRMCFPGYPSEYASWSIKVKFNVFLETATCEKSFDWNNMTDFLQSLTQSCLSRGDLASTAFCLFRESLSFYASQWQLLLFWMCTFWMQRIGSETDEKKHKKNNNNKQSKWMVGDNRSCEPFARWVTLFMITGPGVG